MAGITAYIPGEQANAADVYWDFEDDRLAFVVELSERVGGRDNRDRTMVDYGSDVGIDPDIEPGCVLKFLRSTDYSGIWLRSGTEVYLDRVLAAHDRVRRNRRFIENCKIGNSGHRAIEDWLQELATQSRIRVVSSSHCFYPGEPHQLTSFSAEMIEWLRDDVDRLRRLDDTSFEQLLVQCIGSADYHVRAVNSTRRKDGGVDLVMWPERDLPFVAAVQVKHHGKNGKSTGSADVRDFFGALQRNTVFSFGLLITNTRFTADARDFAKNTMPALRLREGEDVCRWLRGDFSDVSEWQEIPDEICLAPGVSVSIQPAMKLSNIHEEVKHARNLLDLFLPEAYGSVTPFGR